MTNLEDTNYAKFCELLQQDFRGLIIETKRKFPSIKESGENVQKILKEISTLKTDLYKELLVRSATIIQPLLQGCNTQLPKAVSISLTALQRLATYQLLTEEAAAALVGVLWGLMEANIEEVKILQTTILLVTTNNIVKDQNLARALGLCFRLHDSKNSSTVNTATAAIRQCICANLDRMLVEDASNKTINNSNIDDLDLDCLRQNPRNAPTNLNICAKDVYMLFQDLCLMVNKEETHWLQGLNEMTQTLGLELLELILVDYPVIFVEHKEFSYLLKEKVCPLIIKLFSPSLKFKPNLILPGTSNEKPNFPLVGRLIRLITVIIKNYFFLLNTECEIFMSLLIRFLDTEKPLWQRSLALEVLYKCVSQPQLIKHMCENYDMKEHSTKIFREMVYALNSFIQSAFVNLSQPQINHSAKDNISNNTNLPTTHVPAFHYKGNCIPIHMNIRILFFDMLDKTEPPSPPDGYSVSLAFLSIIEIVKSVQSIIEGTDEELKLLDPEGNSKLLDSCWGGILSSFSIFLECSNDEVATETLLRSLRSMISMCGEIELASSLDAFVRTICKASLPPNIAVNVLNESLAVDIKDNFKEVNSDLSNGSVNVYDIGSSIVNVSIVQSPTHAVVVTDKNIQCLRSLLNVAHCHGNHLGKSWHVALLCLQNMVALLGLTITSMGSVVIINGKSNPTTSNNFNSSSTIGCLNIASMLSPPVMADLPVLSAMLSRLFECSQLMDQKPLSDLIDALCKLSKDSAEVGKLNKEPSLFSVAKLMETGMANIKRPQLWWTPIFSSLLEGMSQNHVGLRQLAADAAINLIKETIKVEFEIPFWSNKEIYDLVLKPLFEMSFIKFGDVRQKQLDCIQYILHRYGDQVGESWNLIIEMIGAIESSINEQLVRNSFQCFQLVNTDYILALNTDCYTNIVKVASHFAQQDHDLNISLSAIGTIWYIADFFFQQAETMMKKMSRDEVDELWIYIYCNLMDICVDKRPAARKSAGQTLFNTIELHGDILQLQSWSLLLWRVMFPLLDRVKEFCAVAPEKRNNGNLLMHHSRDTAAKQWAETQVLTLGGVAQIFANKQTLLLKLADFPRAWKLLLEIMESSALLLNQEITENALKSFQSIIMVKCESCTSKSDGEVTLRLMVWKTWVKIGLESTKMALAINVNEKIKNNEKFTTLPSQAFLTILFEMFPQLFASIQSTFSADDFQHFNTVLRQTLVVHLLQFSTLFESHLPSMNSLTLNTEYGYLTALQKMSLEALKMISKVILQENCKLKTLLGMLFTNLLSFATFCVHLPREVQSLFKGDQYPQTFVVFGESCMELAVDLYKGCGHDKLVVDNSVLDQIISMLYQPLSLKYGCPSQTTWLLASHCLMNVMQIGVPIAKQNIKQSAKMWEILSKTLEDFLFSYQMCPSGLSVEEFNKNQELDCKFIFLIRDYILSDSSGVPDNFIEQLINLLNAGTIDTSSSSHTDFDNSRSFREDFARLCFQTLLEYSFLTPQNDNSLISKSNSKANTVSRAAVKATLEKCHSVLQHYVQDERLSGKCPLPRARLSEVGFVFKAMCTLLTAFENTPKERIDACTWEQIIELYPLVVDCVTVTGVQFMKSLREVLHKYKYLLNPMKK